MAQNLDELVKVLELLGETKGAMPMPKSLGKGRPTGWQKNVERMLEDYSKAAESAKANVEIPRSLQTASGGELIVQNNLPVKQKLPSYEASPISKEMTLPRAKPSPKMIEQVVMAEATEIPPVIREAMKAKGFTDDFISRAFPTAATLEAQLANTMLDAPGTGGFGNIISKVSPKVKAAIPALDDLLAKLRPSLDMGKLGSIDKIVDKAAGAEAQAAKSGLAAFGKEAGKEMAEGTAKSAAKTASKFGKWGKIGAGGLAAAGLLGAYLMGDSGQGLEQEALMAAPTGGESANNALLAQLLSGGGRSSELDKALSAMASQIRINAANAERQNRVANAIAAASQQVSDKL